MTWLYGSWTSSPAGPCEKLGARPSTSPTYNRAQAYSTWAAARERWLWKPTNVSGRPVTSPPSTPRRSSSRARSKAARRGAAIDFQPGVVERLPFPEQSFDAVLSTWMMHHLPDDLKRQGLQQIARVLKPGGRLVIVDALQHGHMGHVADLGMGNLNLPDLAVLMKENGVSQVDTGQISLPRTPLFPPTGFILGTKPLPSNSPLVTPDAYPRPQ